MRTISFLPLLFIFGSTIAFSESRGRFTFLDACNDSIIKPQYWAFGPGFKESKVDSMGLIIDTVGSHMLQVIVHRGAVELIFDQTLSIEKPEDLQDTIVLPKLLEEWDVVVDPPPGRVTHFYYCDQLANGDLEDYYRNGKKRMKGSFKNGIPGPIVYYYDERGKLKRKVFYVNGVYKDSR